MPIGVTSPKNRTAVASQVNLFITGHELLLPTDAASFSANVSAHCSGKYQRDSSSLSDNGQSVGSSVSGRPVSSAASSRASRWACGRHAMANGRRLGESSSNCSICRRCFRIVPDQLADRASGWWRHFRTCVSRTVSLLLSSRRSLRPKLSISSAMLPASIAERLPHRKSRACSTVQA